MENRDGGSQPRIESDTHNLSLLTRMELNFVAKPVFLDPMGVIGQSLAQTRSVKLKMAVEVEV